MTDKRTQWIVTSLVAVTAVLATLIVMRSLGDPRPAFGQTGAAVGSDVVGLVGGAYQDRVPLFVIDTKRGKIMVYEYNPRNRTFDFRAVRSYQYDRELEDEIFDSNRGPNVKKVREEVRKKLNP